VGRMDAFCPSRDLVDTQEPGAQVRRMGATAANVNRSPGTKKSGSLSMCEVSGRFLYLIWSRSLDDGFSNEISYQGVVEEVAKHRVCLTPDDLCKSRLSRYCWRTLNSKQPPFQEQRKVEYESERVESLQAKRLPSPD
jgi:hypothetical protein